VEELRAAGFRSEAKLLENWIECHANDRPPEKGMTREEMKLNLSLPSESTRAAWFIFNGNEARTGLHDVCKRALEQDRNFFITRILMGEEPPEEADPWSLDEIEAELRMYENPSSGEG